MMQMRGKMLTRVPEKVTLMIVILMLSLYQRKMKVKKSLKKTGMKVKFEMKLVSDNFINLLTYY